MKRFTPLQKLLMFVYLASIGLFCHHFAFRPLILDWGAPANIRQMELSGDLITEGETHTRAVLIDATPEKIWPWLIQVGQDRGGFYSYQWLENLFRADMKNVYSIQPEFQFPRQRGDTVWLANKEQYGGQAYQVLADVTPFRSFVMMSGEDFERVNRGGKATGSWAFYLHPANEKQTWLIARSTGGSVSFADKFFRYFFFEVPHFIMERKMLVTMRKLTEDKGHVSFSGDEISND